MDAQDLRGVGPTDPRRDLEGIDQPEVLLTEFHQRSSPRRCVILVNSGMFLNFYRALEDCEASHSTMAMDTYQSFRKQENRCRSPQTPKRCREKSPGSATSSTRNRKSAWTSRAPRKRCSRRSTDSRTKSPLARA